MAESRHRDRQSWRVRRGRDHHERDSLPALLHPGLDGADCGHGRDRAGHHDGDLDPWKCRCRSSDGVRDLPFDCLRGGSFIIAGSLILSTLTPVASVAHAAFGASLVGVGLGFCNTTWVVSVQTQVSYAQRGSATSAILFMRFLGQAIGAAVAGIILTVALRHYLPGVADPLGKLLGDARTGADTGSEMRQLAIAVGDCFRGIFAMAGLLGLATLALAFQLPRGISAGSPARPHR